jgi:hypothetical protein
MCPKRLSNNRRRKVQGLGSARLADPNVRLRNDYQAVEDEILGSIANRSVTASLGIPVASTSRWQHGRAINLTTCRRTFLRLVSPTLRLIRMQRALQAIKDGHAELAE